VTTTGTGVGPAVFTSPQHDARNAALLGSALGISFTVCFATGLFSHLAQYAPGWFELPARPAGLVLVVAVAWALVRRRSAGSSGDDLAAPVDPHPAHPVDAHPVDAHPVEA